MTTNNQTIAPPEQSHVVTPEREFVGYCAWCFRPDSNTIIIPKAWLTVQHGTHQTLAIHKACFVEMATQAAAHLSPAFRRRIIRAMQAEDKA